MLVVIECADVTEGGDRFAQMYAYPVESESGGELDAPVRDANMALAMVRSLSSGAADGIRAGRPPREPKPIFCTFLDVSGVRGKYARYKIAYRRMEFGGEYNRVAAEQMEFYRDLKAVIKRAAK